MDGVRGARKVAPGQPTTTHRKQEFPLARYDSIPPVFFDSGEVYDEEEAPQPTRNKRMAKIRKDWSKMNRAERIALAQTVSTALTGNAPFAALNPTAAQLEALRAASAAAEQAVKDEEVNMAALRAAATAANDALLTGLERVALSAEGIAQGSEALLSTTGYNLVTNTGGGPSLDMTQPINFSLTAGDFDGQLDGHCDPVRGARGYNVHITTAMTPTPVWEDRDDTPNTQFSLTGLTQRPARVGADAGLWHEGPRPVERPGDEDRAVGMEER